MQAAQAQRRFRGKNKAPKWKKPEDGQVSVMVLPLAVTDPADLARLETLLGSMRSVKRAVHRDARAKVDAYWAAKNERDEHGAKAVRERLGLSREALERCAYKHLESSGHLKHHVSKAMAMHMADEVWNGVQRHLFPDNSGKRHGRPKAGRWHDYTRIPGRARSHTTDRKWETFRLVGTLDGHTMAYTGSDRHTLLQPSRMPVPAAPSGVVPTGKATASGKPGTRKATWWDHTGPLAVVFAGGPDSHAGDLVFPVRIPQQPGQWKRVEHFLANSGRWHKVDLVRRRKASAPGGWVYEAHLMILGPGYTAPAVRQMRERAAALDRIGGVDGNVSNISVVSFPASITPVDGAPASTEITLSPEERALLEREAKNRRGRARALERSRRATNTAQYGLSKKQAKRAERRAEEGLKPKAVSVPGGSRASRSDGVPKQAFHRDRLSTGHRKLRARQAEAAASAADRRGHRARLLARQIVAAHGPVLVVEDCDISTWYRLWGKRLSQTTPGLLIAALAAFVRFTDAGDPKTAYLDTAASRHAQIVFAQGLEEALRESTTQNRTTARGAGRVAVPRQRRGTSAPRTTAWRSRATPDETRPVRDHAGKPGHRPGCSPRLTFWRITGQVLANCSSCSPDTPYR
ncbi:transposase [Streptomyces sp. NBC_00091]|uniref:transposase n=1 Tax=Streptomyces sp. NBC_00091 TaxID=2975648 RepID=UPI0022564A3B|nr:transposase [Streptomyces sp. NBC_00091]MCX5376248.1 transposase [Streptomyces sp. NBC_00091]